MQQVITSDFKLGVIAGGQLGKMLLLAASNWDIKTHILDPDENCSCATICTHFTKGSITDYDTVYNFGKQVDLLTFEIENINIEALLKLKSEGKIIYPEPEALQLIQDKGLQKDFYKKNNFPTSEYVLLNSKKEVIAAVQNKTIELPFVQKLRKAGYDGKGVQVINTTNDFEKLFDAPCVVENKVKIKKEVAVIAARNSKGNINSFPLVEMEFNDNANLVEQLICPSSVDETIQQKAKQIAEELILKLNMTGILAVEFFLDADNNLYVNEVAPRPHNSGHHTIDSCITSQYEQHLRCIFGFPLGATKIKMPSVMINMLGDKAHSGKVKYEGVEDIMAIEGVKMHIYGKKEMRPYRKMGHITILAETVDKAIEKAKQVNKLLSITSWK